MYGQTATALPPFQGTTTGLLTTKAPTSGIGSDLSQLMEVARRIRNTSTFILARLEGSKPEPLTNKTEAALPSTNVRSILGDLLGILYATEATVVEIDNALGSL